MASRGPAETSSVRRVRRAERRRALVSTRILVYLAVAFTVVAGVVAGLQGLGYPLLVALLFVVPGDLVRRAALPAQRFRTVETVAIDFGASCVALVVVGLIVTGVGIAGRPGSLACLVAGGVACVAVARRRGRESASRDPVSSTVRAVAVVVILACVGVLLFHVSALVGDRIYLGQLRTSVELTRRRELPTVTWTYGAWTPFPSNYVLYNVMFAVIAWVGGLAGWSSWREITGVLRVVQLGMFAVAWYLVGVEMLRGFTHNLATRVCAALVPLLLLYNFGFVAKFREPLIEGFGTVLVGIGLWALIRSTGNRTAAGRWTFWLSVAVTALLLGMHLPVFGEAVVLLGAWVLVMPPGRVTRGVPWYRKAALLDRVRATLLCVSFYAAGVVAVVLAMLLAFGLTPLGLATAPVTERAAYRAYLLYLGSPLSPEPLRYYVMQRVSRAFLFVVPPFSGRVAVFALAGVVGLVLGLRRGARRLRPLVWIAVVALLTAMYAAVGFSFGRTKVTPWNAVTRNGFYLWLPVVLAVVFGLRLFFAWIEPRLDRRALRLRRVAVVVAAIVLVVAAVQPLSKQYGTTLRETGWIVVPPMTHDGERALEWVSAHTPAGARVLLSEQTFGSSLVSDRLMVTEGFATLESKPVTRAAANALPLATEFFLPVHSPLVITRYDVDYVVARGGAYLFGVMGGFPLLAQYAGPLTPVAGDLALESVPYLHPVDHFGDVTIYRVDRSAIPPTVVVRVAAGDPIPPCASTQCIVRHAVEAPSACPPEQLSAEPGVCIQRLGLGQGGP